MLSLFDYQNSFDTVPHCLVLDELSVTANYLTSTNVRVVVDGVVSRTSPMLSGNPQCSVLDPLLFFLYIDCATKILTSPDTQNSVLLMTSSFINQSLLPVICIPFGRL